MTYNDSVRWLYAQGGTWRTTEIADGALVIASLRGMEAHGHALDLSTEQLQAALVVAVSSLKEREQPSGD